MSHSQLENLQQQFAKALHEQIYLKLNEEDHIVASPEKCDSLHEIFLLASSDIEKACKEIEEKKDLKTLGVEISHLKQLEEDAKTIYTRYEKHTNTWIRWFLKGLSRNTPGFLKVVLPTCFSNKAEEAEKKTKEEYEAYRDLLIQSVTNLTKLKPAGVELKKDGAKEATPAAPAGPQTEQKKPSAPAPDAATQKKPTENLDEDEDEDEDIKRACALSMEKSVPKEAKPISKPQQNGPSPEQIAKKLQLGTAQSLKDIKKGVELLNNHEKKPISLRRYKTNIEKVSKAIHFLQEKSPEIELAKETSLDEKTLAALSKHSEIQQALAANNDAELLELLQDTPFITDLKGAAEQKGHIKFGVKTLPGGTEKLLQLANEKGLIIKENDLNTFKGTLKVFLIDKKNTSIFDDLTKKLDETPKCQPRSLEINFGAGMKLTPELFTILLKLQEKIPDIHLTDLNEINFQELNVSKEQEHQFIGQISGFSAPQIESVILSTHSKEKWSEEDFNALLEFCPTFELLKQCYSSCSATQLILVPSTLTSTQKIDLKGFPLNHIPSLLEQLPELLSVSFNGLEITDAQLKTWISEGHFEKVQHLDLTGCSKLTTDVLPHLISLPCLGSPVLPDLPQGELKLEDLPKLDNPVKIKQFYLASKATQTVASKLYTGPSAWASVFQIPLARLGVAEVFSPHQLILDPKSIAYWLHKGDYKTLHPQSGIKTILADSNANLTDDNLAEFVQKFPKASVISLYNCPNITDAGVVKMLKACPHIVILDLNCCPKITDQLFLGDGHVEVLKKLQKIFISDTGMAPDIAELTKDMGGLENNDGKRPTILYEKTVLTVTDDDLVDEESLEKILTSNNLFRMNRIDFTGCTKLNDQMLGKLLDRLNTDMWIKSIDGTMIDNPQRLNLGVLDLNLCANITVGAFQTTTNGKMDFKLLENLDRVITTGTKITKSLEKVYPQVIFQEISKPVTITVNPKQQLQACAEYLTKKKASLEAPQDEKAKAELKLASKDFIHNRIVVELFPDECGEEESKQDVLGQSIDLNCEDFNDITLTFTPVLLDDNKTMEPLTIPSHRDVLYGQSFYFKTGLRPGGMISKTANLNLEHKYATPQAAQAVIDLIYGHLKEDELDWKTAADAAELTKIFKMPSEYTEKLVIRMRSQFDLDNAEEILLRTQMLKNQASFNEFQDTLMVFLENEEVNSEVFLKIANLAQSYKERMPKLFDEVAQKQKKLNDDVVLLTHLEMNQKQNQKQVEKNKNASNLWGFFG